MDIAGLTHIGKVRQENQDGFLAQRIQPDGLAALPCIAVADGMGGHALGHQASETALRILQESIEKNPDRLPFGAELARRVLLSAHEAVRELGKKDERVGTTLTFAFIRGKHVIYGHIGDSRIYLYRAGTLTQLTTDQTWDVYSKKHGLQNEHGRALQQAIGVGDTLEPETGEIILGANDLLMVCTDGLTKMMTDAEIAGEVKRAKTAQAACDRLLSFALDRGGKDNVAISVLRAAEPPVVGAKSPRMWALVAAVTLVLLAVGVVYLNS